MPVHDMTITVECDKCETKRSFEPEWVFTDYSGNNGHYNTKVSSLLTELESEYCEKWEEDMDGEILCESCAEENNDDEDD